jgi:Lanthionine-containing peptide SapB precursor RamS
VSHVLDLQTVEVSQPAGRAEWEVEYYPSTPSLLCHPVSLISTTLCN